MKKWIVPTILGFGLVLVACYVLFGFSINWPGEMEAARAKWEAQGITNYRYHVSFSAVNSIAAVFVTVLDGEVAKVEEDESWNLYGPPPPIDQRIRTPIEILPGWYAFTFSKYLPPDLSHYSIEKLFGFAQEIRIEYPKPFIEFYTNFPTNNYIMEYDDNLGYIKFLMRSNCPEPEYGPLISRPMAHCGIAFRITDFEVLDD